MTSPDEAVRPAWTAEHIGEYDDGSPTFALIEDGREICVGPESRIRLMAAAPALLKHCEALEAALQPMVRGTEWITAEGVQRARLALSRSTGAV